MTITDDKQLFSSNILLFVQICFGSWKCNFSIPCPFLVWSSALLKPVKIEDAMVVQDWGIPYDLRRPGLGNYDQKCQNWSLQNHFSHRGVVLYSVTEESADESWNSILGLAVSFPNVETSRNRTPKTTPRGRHPQIPSSGAFRVIVSSVVV